MVERVKSNRETKKMRKYSLKKLKILITNMRSSKMKIMLLISLLLTVTSCSSTRVKEDWAESVTKISGYLTAPPTLEDKRGYGKKEELKRCQKVQFTGVFKTPGMMNYKAEVSQGDRKFIIEQFGNSYVLSSNQLTGSSNNPQKEVIDVFRGYVTDELPFKKKKVGKGKDRIDLYDYLCNEKGVFTGMTKEQFIFVMGYPKKNNRTVTRTVVKEQLIFQKPGGNEFEKNYFYFTNGVLTSWQN